MVWLSVSKAQWFNINAVEQLLQRYSGFLCLLQNVLTRWSVLPQCYLDFLQYSGLVTFSFNVLQYSACVSFWLFAVPCLELCHSEGFSVFCLCVILTSCSVLPRTVILKFLQYSACQFVSLFTVSCLELWFCSPQICLSVGSRGHSWDKRSAQNWLCTF